MSEKRMLLILPPLNGLLSGFASGIISLAEYIELHKNEIEDKIEIELLDFSCFSDEEVKIKSLEYSDIEHLIVGISTTTASYQPALNVAKNFKKSNKKCTTILGGHHASADAKIILANHKTIIDYIIYGEGEIALYEFIKSYPEVESTPNLIFRKESKIITNNPAPYLKTDVLDQISLSYKEIKFYGMSGKFDTITYMSSRGCPFNCSFCAVSNQQIRTKSIYQIKNDLVKLLETGHSTITFEDNFFAHNQNRTYAICNELKKVKLKYPNFKWDCQTRVESLKDHSIVQAMENAGCYAIYIGAEALSARDLIYLGKTKNGKRYLELFFEQVLPNMLSSKIDCYLNLQLGLPESQFFKETKVNLERIGNYAIKADKKVTIFPMLHVIYPGTKHFHDGLKSNYWQENVFEFFTKWEQEQINFYNWLGGNFAHGTGGIPYGILDKTNLMENKFSIDSEAVFEIQKQLSIIKKIQGLSIFDYQSFLI